MRPTYPAAACLCLLACAPLGFRSEPEPEDEASPLVEMLERRAEEFERAAEGATSQAEFLQLRLQALEQQLMANEERLRGAEERREAEVSGAGGGGGIDTSLGSLLDAATVAIGGGGLMAALRALTKAKGPSRAQPEIDKLREEGTDLRYQVERLRGLLDAQAGTGQPGPAPIISMESQQSHAYHQPRQPTA